MKSKKSMRGGKRASDVLESRGGGNLVETHRRVHANSSRMKRIQAAVWKPRQQNSDWAIANRVRTAIGSSFWLRLPASPVGRID